MRAALALLLLLAAPARAQDEGPQLVTRQGEEVAFVVSAEPYRALGLARDELPAHSPER